MKRLTNIASEEIFNRLQQIEEDLLIYFQYPDKKLFDLIKNDLNIIQMNFEYFEQDELNIITKDLQTNLYFASHELKELTVEDVRLCFEEIHLIENLMINLKL